MQRIKGIVKTGRDVNASGFCEAISRRTYVETASGTCVGDIKYATVLDKVKEMTAANVPKRTKGV
jgi:hypothetical protein